VKAQAGSAADFEAVFPVLLARAVRVAYRILGDVTEGEDAAAEALARALVAWPRVGVLPYREAWVLRVAANVAMDAARKRQRSSLRRARAVETTIEADQSDWVVLDVALRAAIVTLPRRKREVVVLRYLVDLSEADVAAALGISLGAVKQHGHRGLAALRQQVGYDPVV